MKPNFFIVGAPKSGTTSLYEYLRVHPQIIMPRIIKEPHFFVSDFPTIKFKGSKEEYLSLFKSKKKALAVGESSTRYLYSKTAAHEISIFNPNAKIIAILRNPIEMIPSWHNQLIYSVEEEINDLYKALLAEKYRRLGQNIPKSCQFVEGLYYSEIAKYYEQISRYLKYFEKQQIKIILFDEFRNNTLRVYKDILHFLEVDDSFKPNFKVYNVSSGNRVKVIKKFIKKQKPKLIRKITHSLFSLNFRYYLNDILNKINTKQIKKNIPEKKSIEILIEYYSNDIAKLSDLLQIDLKIIWLKKYIN